MGISFFQSGGGVASHTPGLSLFRTSGTFTVPANVTTLLVSLARATGGGGVGAFSDQSESGSASGGAQGWDVYNQSITVTPGQTITVTIGARGVGGQGRYWDGNGFNWGNSGTSGGTTSFGSYISQSGYSGGSGGGPDDPYGATAYGGFGGRGYVNGNNGEHSRYERNGYDASPTLCAFQAYCPSPVYSSNPLNNPVTTERGGDGMSGLVLVIW